MADEKIKIRSLEPSDINFIYATMLRGLYYGNTFYKKIDKSAFFLNYDTYLGNLLAKSDSVVKVACLESDSDIILGYAIYTPLKALHYVFVKDAWRRRGVAKMLIPTGLPSVSQITDLGDVLRIKNNMIFNPWL